MASTSTMTAPLNFLLKWLQKLQYLLRTTRWQYNTCTRIKKLNRAVVGLLVNLCREFSFVAVSFGQATSLCVYEVCFVFSVTVLLCEDILQRGNQVSGVVIRFSSSFCSSSVFHKTCRPTQMKRIRQLHFRQLWKQKTSHVLFRAEQYEHHTDKMNVVGWRSFQRLKAAVHYTVGRICQKIGGEQRREFSRQVIAAIAETAVRQCGGWQHSSV